MSTTIHVRSCTFNLTFVTDTDFEQYLNDERTYLEKLQSEPPEETLCYQYVEALQEFAKQR